MMRIRLRYWARLLLAGWLTWQPLAPSQAQLATLVADNVAFDGEDRLVASGNVEVFYEGQRVLADRLVYDRGADELQVIGPITLVEESGQVLVADFAQLSGDLRDGIIQGARLVLDEQLQLAAAEINRVDGRYTQLYKTVASSCRVCEDDPTPLWRIRAEKVVHDQQERQLYFRNARFEVLGLPVFYSPYLRLPDPSLRRATGFLVPSLKQTSELGFGFRFPYFITLGDHADITLTPYLSANSRTLETRYRQVFRWGAVELEGAVSRDDLRPGETRAYLSGIGRFRLPGDFKLNLDVDLVSDNAYLLTYGFSDADRLSNGIEITRTRRNEYISARVETLRTLRDSEVPIEDTLATNLARATYERRLPGVGGGEARLTFDVLGYEREADRVDAALLSACASVTPPITSECLARDVFRASAEAGYVRNWEFGNGALLRAETELAADAYVIGQDSSFDNTLSRVTPAAALELRWPLARTAANGARDILQPVAQVAWSETYGDVVPNEDSRLVEFDEGNLLSLSRFPGRDRRETGARATLGLAWTHFTPTGGEYALAAARVFRAEDARLFTAASGLDGTRSDWLVAGRVELGDSLSLNNRSLFDDSLDFTKSETRLTYGGDRLAAAASYIWLDSELAEGRDDDVSELNVDVAYEFNRHFTGSFDVRYDLIAGSTAEAAVGLGYRNECVNVDLSLSRRFTSSTNVAPTTDVGLQVSLNGFGRDGRPYARNCRYVKG
jgi:LPS-assembly protein